MKLRSRIKSEFNKGDRKFVFIFIVVVRFKMASLFANFGLSVGLEGFANVLEISFLSYS